MSRKFTYSKDIVKLSLSSLISSKLFMVNKALMVVGLSFGKEVLQYPSGMSTQQHFSEEHCSEVDAWAIASAESRISFSLNIFLCLNIMSLVACCLNTVKRGTSISHLLEALSDLIPAVTP